MVVTSNKQSVSEPVVVRNKQALKREVLTAVDRFAFLRRFSSVYNF